MIADEVPDVDDPCWLRYNDKWHIKQTCNTWNRFPSHTYMLFNYLMAPNVVEKIANWFGVDTLVPDIGLHGGGWHFHGNSGVLNPHLDYNIHPKLGLQRRINLLIYLEPQMKEEYGGHLGFFAGDEKSPNGLVVEIAPKFNRAVFFDTSENSWHGISRELDMPYGVFRKSIAVYYLCAPPDNPTYRYKAEFIK